MSKLNPYMKAVVGVLGAVLSSLSVYYGHDHWYPVVTTAVTAALVYLVPNTPNNSNQG